MAKRHILIIYTGGTIGMKPSDTGYHPETNYLQSALQALTALHHPDMPHYTLLEHFPLQDSANIQPADWVTIANNIAQNYDQYDGFLILHGTDTLAYTASALSFMLENLGKPVICTGSQIPIGELRSDGARNLIDSLYILGHYDFYEVAIYFNGQILRGNRTRKMDASQLHAFDSPNFPLLGQAGVRIEWRSALLRHKPQKPFILRSIKAPMIANLQIFPGISTTLLATLLAQPLDGLALGTYGTGNAPNQDKTFLKVIEQACERGIVIINYSQCWRGFVNQGDYQTGSALAQAGVVSAHDMTPEATLTKLYYLLSTELDLPGVRQAVETDLRGELTSPFRPYTGVAAHVMV